MGGIGFIEQTPAIDCLKEPASLQWFASSRLAKLPPVGLVLLHRCQCLGLAVISSALSGSGLADRGSDRKPPLECGFVEDRNE